MLLIDLIKYCTHNLIKKTIYNIIYIFDKYNKDNKLKSR